MQTILVIDDDDALRNTVACALERNAFKVVTARSGAEGIRLAEIHLPGLILCDLNMEETGGAALFTALRKEPITANIPFVLMTGEFAKANKNGPDKLPDDFLLKPFTVAQLLSAVHSGLKKKVKSRHAAESAQPVAPIVSSIGPSPAKRLKASREQLEALSHRLQLLLEKERRRVARVIHDDLSQDLTVLALEISFLDSNLQNPIEKLPLAQCRESLRKLTPLIGNLIQSAQKIAADIRPKVLDEFGLVAGLEWLMEQFYNKSGIKCELHLAKSNLIPDAKVATELYRLAEEVVSNVEQHARATVVAISLAERAGHLRLEIKDNGKGITRRQIQDPQSLGLLAMAKRMEYLGGTFSIAGQPGKGTTVIAQVPFEPPLNL